MIAAFPPARRILVVSLFALLLHAADAEAKGFFLLTWGESVFHVSQVAEPEQTALQERLHRGVALGYEYSYAGVFWLDLWTWDGQWCLYNGRTFWKLTPDQAAAILHTTADELDKPKLFWFNPEKKIRATIHQGYGKENEVNFEPYLPAKELVGEGKEKLGFETTPWSNARLTSTLNQSRITEYGPRTFALFGLNQRFLAGERWGFDVSIDSSHAFNESGDAPLVVDPSQPIATGGLRDGGALTEDFTALSGGATYRTPLWSWNMRAETRQGDSNDRHGFTSAFLRQARDGVALSASVHAFSQHNADGSTGLLGNAQISWAYRPPGSRWSMLDKLEFRLDEIRHGRGEPIIGNDTVAAVGDARSRRLVNNFAVNYASDAWASEDSRGVLSLDQRSQLSLYYGSRYVLDSFGDDDYSGYTDIIGAEWRLDLSSRLDIGLRASVLHSWSQDTYAWALGPSIGFTPFTNAWVSLGYNVRGFQDRDFENAHHTAQGPYLVFRMKFDQQSLGLDRNSAGPDQ